MENKNTPTEQVGNTGNYSKTIERIASHVVGLKMNDQQSYEKDLDYGLIPEKPIITSKYDLIEGQSNFLKKLRTIKGEKIKWALKGSVIVDGIIGEVKIYDISEYDGQFYKTIFMNDNGNKTSQQAPNGFILLDTSDKESLIDKHFESSKKYHNSTDYLFYGGFQRRSKGKKTPEQIISIILFILSLMIAVGSIIAIIIATINEDSRRLLYEHWNTRIVYFCLMALLGLFIIVSSIAFITKHQIIVSFAAFPAFIFSQIVLLEGSVFSYQWESIIYNNSRIIYICNSIWYYGSWGLIIASFLLFIKYEISSLVRKHANNKGHQEKALKQIVRLHDFYERGVISLEDYIPLKEKMFDNIIVGLKNSKESMEKKLMRLDRLHFYTEKGVLTKSDYFEAKSILLKK